MIRTQISLTREQHEQLKRRAEARGVSMSQLVREAIASAEFGRRERAEQARAVFGRYGSGRSDVSRQHDRHLEEAYRDR